MESLVYGERGSYTVRELLHAWIEGKLVFPIIRKDGEPENTVESEFETLPEEKQEEARRRYTILEPFIKKDKNSKELKEHLKLHRISHGTFYNWLRVWEHYRDLRYLAPHKDKRGPKERVSDDVVVTMAKKVIDDMAYDGPKETIMAMYRELKLRVKESNELRDPDDQLKPLSRTTFWRIYTDMKDLQKQNELRYGKPKADLIRRGSRGRIHTDRILERVEIDWTRADLFLVNPLTLKRERPWLVYAIDVHSGEPLGFHTTFKTPGSAEVRQCLLHCFLPKTYIKETYPMVKNEWTAYGIPREIVVDNALANESYDLQDVCKIFGIDLQFCSIASGHQKGTIERAFKTLNQKLIHRAPGTTFSNPFERGEYDSEGEACITLQAFNYLVHIALVDMISHDWKHSVTRAGIPHRLWHKSLKENPHLRLSIPRNLKELTIVMGSGLEYRKITNKGITISGLNYQSPELMDLRYDMEKLGRQSEEVRIRYNADDLRIIYIRDAINNVFVEAYPDEEVLVDKNIRLDLPVPFQQLQLKSAQKNDEKTSHDALHVGEAARAQKAIFNQQKEDMKQGFPETIAETAAQAVQVSSIGFEPTADMLPEEAQSIRDIVGKTSNEAKGTGARTGGKKGGKKQESQKQEDPEITEDGTKCAPDVMKQGFEEDLEILKRAIRGAS